MAEKKQWKDMTKSEKIIGLIVGAVMLVIVILIISAVVGDSNKDSGQKQSLAQKVEKKYVESWGVDNLSETQTLDDIATALQSVTKFEDVSSGTVRVYIQDDITEEQAKNAGKQIMGIVCLDIDNLDFIVPQGTNGRDVNVSRSEVPACS